MISFKKLDRLLKDRGIKKTDLKTKGIIGGGTYTAVSSAMKTPIADGVSISAVDRICAFLDCQPGDIMEWIPDR